MKKLLLLTKTLLAVALLCVGQNAWAGIISPSAGNVDNSTAWNTWDEGFTQNYTMSGNSTASFTFHYTSDPTASAYAGWTMFIGKTINTTDVWDTWITCQGFSGGYYGAAGVGGTRASSNTYAGTLSAASCTEADVTVTITRTAENITAVAAVDPTNGDGDYTITWTYTYGGSDVVNGDLYISFAVEKAYLNITNVVGPGLKTTQADINFSNAIVNNTIAGTLNSMALSGNYELGYTSGDPATTVLGDVLRVGNGTGTVTISDVQLSGLRDEVVMTFDYYLGHLSGKKVGFYLYDGSATPNVIGALYFTPYDRTTAPDINSFGFDTSYDKIPNQKTKNYTDNANICTDAYKISFELHLNYALGTMYAKQYTNGVLKQTTTPVTMSSTNPLKSFVVQSDYATATRRCWFDNLKIYTIKGDYSSSEVGYIVKFVDGNGTKIKEDVTDRENIEGTAISDLATSDDQTTFYNDGDIANNSTVEFVGATNKYVYKSISAVNSSEEPITELEADAVVTIVYDKYNKYDYAVKQKLGDAAATDKTTGTLWEDQTYSYYFPVGVKDGGDYYFTEANGSSPYFKGTLTSAAPTVTINYTLDPTVVFYSEGENLTSKTGTFTEFSALMANGSSGVLNNEDGNLVVNLSEGIYTITARTVGRGDGDTRKIKFYKGSVDAENIVLTATPDKISGSTETSDAFALAAATDILVKGAAGGGANGNGLDYVIIKKYPSTVTATIGSTGWTTFASPYALNLSSMTASTGSVAAYYAHETTAEYVIMESTNSSAVISNEGLMLKGTPGATITIPVVASGSALDGNLLVGCYDGETLTVNASKYVLVNNGGTAEFQCLDKNGATIPAGKAYLNVSLGSPARALRIAFAGDITGINEAAQAAEAAHKDGKFIENGKLVIVKNGQKFNAAGQQVK